MNVDEKLMAQCIRLAKKGKGFVSPNPLVGSIIRKGNKIIGRGYHKKYGDAHAEVNAIADAERKGFNVKDAELFVNLEPCAHKGKTSSCAEFIVSKKIKRVVIGMKDPFEKVNGKGIEILKENGTDVSCGILEDECRELNKFFIKYVTKKLPYVTLKIAQSIDGKIALNNFESKYITGSASRKAVHLLRSEYDAVLIGRNTALSDNPSLTVRDVEGRDPLRLVIDRKNTLPSDLNLFSDGNRIKTFVITGKSAAESKANKYLIRMPDDSKVFKIKNLLKLLYKFKLNSILVEGGSKLFSQFVKEGMFDEIYFFIAPVIIGNGISPFGEIEIKSLKDKKILSKESIETLENDVLIKYRKCLRE
ncbi:MAG TPA: bifunctional diaminohydroxyphosphoribosylaminopyrimidine deaminase/5-amino-6-(5-phosphoribosylamino)uracil reductase RibD [Ignavibacteria bacterium]|nr:bifunctional diaminohydroxyphosphoribosylaminopyrimidine deaminase/5-amino-6-(5-phosphoribosylamino)uracil reductase RibD [Bacteroidota bacterium]HRI83985.1 bifunctional diaminohydroxyphosphoribosylaminopyrimidine deaminase/5-amino-6-(5-phosphoribosylamino)uracil reductase RibD [Ignavibacteria bacterium]HRJ99182.1 bifunctional diaminohydroxyphosphoribosylaminopyrimidine deaminase/5-amino-6-(5-phosphoribosylamino)uracil reductase RibD [Ignavibacteria bacterium]